MGMTDNMAFKAVQNNTQSTADNIFDTGGSISSKQPSKDEVYNFLQIAIADKVFGGAMDPVEGSTWRRGELKTPFGDKMKPMNLKSMLLGTGAKSREGYAERYGVEEVNIDTLSYDDLRNFEFNITSPDDPSLQAKIKQTGSGLGNKNVVPFGFDIDKYQDASLKRKYGDDLFGQMDDESSSKYSGYMKGINKMYKKDTFVDDILGDPYYKEKFDLYAKSFGSE